MNFGFESVTLFYRQIFSTIVIVLLIFAQIDVRKFNRALRFEN